MSSVREQNRDNVHLRPYAVISVLILVLVSLNVLLVRNLRTTSFKCGESRSLRTIFKQEIESYGTRFHNLVTGGDVKNARCVMIAATGPNYSFAKSWAENRRYEGVPFVHVSMSDIRNNELNSNWARLPALFAAKRALPLAKLLVYTDIDTLLNWPLACKHASKAAMTISYKLEGKARRLELRSNWFIVRTTHEGINHLLHSWYYKGRDVRWQDQKILNELYRNKRWLNNSITALKTGEWPHKAIELQHCGSWLKRPNRVRCLNQLRLDKFLDGSTKQ